MLFIICEYKNLFGKVKTKTLSISEKQYEIMKHVAEVQGYSFRGWVKEAQKQTYKKRFIDVWIVFK